MEKHGASDSIGLTRKITKTKIAAVSLIILTIWIFYIESVAGTFQTIHNYDPLSMIDALFPYFWVILILLASLSVACLYFDINSKGLYSLLLSEISLVLFYTPFVLSGFSWNPDALWHGGIASYIPQIMHDVIPTQLPLGVYAQSYPLSYLLTYSMEKTTGMDLITFGTYLYPLFIILLTTLLGFIFLSRVFNPRIAFVSMLLALSSMHFIEEHVSPFSLGTVLVLGALVMLTIDSRVAKGLLFLLMLACVMTHPISPISLGIFLVPIVLLTMLKEKLGFTGSLSEIQLKVPVDSVIFLIILWLGWTLYYSLSVYASIDYTIYKLLTFSFLSQIEHVSKFTSTGGFYFGQISLLEEGIYAIIAAFAVITVLINLYKIVLHKKRDLTDFLGLLFSLLTLLFAVFSFALFLSTGEQTLLGRGLVFFSLVGGVCIALLLQGGTSKKLRFFRLKNALAVLLIMLFFVSYPIVSYSREAYNTFTPSFGTGLSFLSTITDISNLNVSMSSYQQLAAYVNLSNGLLPSLYPPPVNRSGPNLVVLTINSYFDNALRYSLSFQNNTYTTLKEELQNPTYGQTNTTYDQVYSNPSVAIYSSAGK